MINLCSKLYIADGDIQQIHGRVYFKRGVQPKCGVQNENCGVQD